MSTVLTEAAKVQVKIKDSHRMLVSKFKRLVKAATYQKEHPIPNLLATNPRNA